MTQQKAGIQALQTISGSTFWSAAQWNWGGTTAADPTSPTGYSTYNTANAPLVSVWGGSSIVGGREFAATPSTISFVISEGTPLISNTLNGALAAGDTSMTLTIPSTSIYAANGCFQIDQEFICTTGGAPSVGTTVFTITRGNYGTLAQAHSNGAAVVSVGTAGMYITCNSVNVAAASLIYTPQWTTVSMPFQADKCSGYSANIRNAGAVGPTGQKYGWAGVVIQPATQIPQAATASVVPVSVSTGGSQYPWTGTKPLAGSGTGIVTGPTSGVTSGHPVCYTGRGRADAGWRCLAACINSFRDQCEYRRFGSDSRAVCERNS